MPLFVHIFTVLAVASGLRTRRQTAGNFLSDQDGVVSEAYTFDKFARDFGRMYVPGGAEYLHRAAVFQDSLAQIYAKNSRAGRSWTAGVHPFMDWTGAERADRLHGYEPMASRRSTEQRLLAAMQTGTQAVIFDRLYGGADDSFEADAPPVRDQGGLCGSCWAFSAVAAVEAQLRKDGSPWQWDKGEPQLSVEAILDCAPNPRHCGGKGGCHGGTPELAFEFMQNTGVPTEQNLPYHPLHKANCPIQPYPPNWERVSLAGWRALPSNQAQPLMQALVQDGPVVVAVDAHEDWYHYQSGIFDGCPKDAILNHGVLAKGYGVADGKKYWRLQNSWGTKWGEQGSIRLARQDDEDSWCGTDSRPEEGFACEDEVHRNLTVCGTCGLLFDMTIPRVGRVTVGQGVASVSSGIAPASFEPDATSDMDLLGTYSGGTASSGTAIANFKVKSPSESPVAMPRLSENRLADSHDGGLEISDASTADNMANTPIADAVQYWDSVKAHQADPQSTKVQELVAEHFTVEPAVDSMTDLVDVLPTEDEKFQTPAVPTPDFAVSMADALHAGLATPPEALGESWFAWNTESDLSKQAAVFDLHSKDAQPHGDTSSASFADHVSSGADPSLPGVRSEAKMPFRALKATDSMDAYVHLED